MAIEFDPPVTPDSPATSDDGADAPENPAASASAVLATSPGRPAWIGVVAVTAALFLLAGVVWLAARPTEPDLGGRGAVPSERLAAEPEELWARQLPQGLTPIDAVVLPSGAIAVTGVGPSGSTLTAFETADGSTRWEHRFDAGTLGARTITATDESLVVQVDLADGRLLTGFDPVDGSIRWSTSIDRNAAFVSLPGAQPIVELTFDPDPPFTESVVALDPDTGEPLGSVTGTIAATDWDGTWFVRDEDGLLALDLSDGWSEPVRSTTAVDPTVSALVVTRGAVIGIDGNGVLRNVAPDGTEIELPTSWRGSVDWIGSVGGDHVVIGGDGRFAGLNLADGRTAVEWDAEGSIEEFRASVDGTIIIGRSPDSEMWALDALTGDRLVESMAEPGPQPAVDGDDPSGAPSADGRARSQSTTDLRDGFVVAAPGTVTAYDLDGDLRWTSPTDEIWAVGDRVAVFFAGAGDTVSMRAVGDACVPECG